MKKLSLQGIYTCIRVNGKIMDTENWKQIEYLSLYSQARKCVEFQ